MSFHVKRKDGAASGRPVSAGAVLQPIASNQATSRSDIGRLTGLSRIAITARVNQLKPFVAGIRETTYPNGPRHWQRGSCPLWPAPSASG